MQLDDLKAAWTAHGNALERSLAIDERLLRELLLRKIRFALAPYVCWRVFEIACGLLGLALCVQVFVQHVTEPRYVLVAGALVVHTVGCVALSAYLLVRSLQLDYDGPVTAIQRAVERLKRVEYGALKWTLLGGVLLWLPALLVLFEALTGIAALARIEPATLAANLAFGIVVLVVGQALSKRYVERPDLSPWARRLVDAASGHSLRKVTKHLAELSSFELEDGTVR
jgi:hypothetical protein